MPATNERTTVITNRYRTVVGRHKGIPIAICPEARESRRNMEDPCMTTEIDEMTRALDPNNTDLSTNAPSGPAVGEVDRLLKGGVSAAGAAALAPDSSAPASSARRGGTTQAVCPFCGSINEAATGPCRQCNMENTQATRQATRAKIGPWFVWQSRNPSAPGMNWVTLLSLVEKGRITPRSVVRGPTTGQLWRFAARVKGISREFGACWHCGGEVPRAARLCTNCKRLQQPPINPDALLETSTDANIAPIHKSVADPQFRGQIAVGAQPVRMEVPVTAPASNRAAAAIGLLQSPAFTDSPIDPSVPIIDMDDTLPTGMEFRAFQLDGPEDSLKSSSGAFRRIVVAAALTILGILPILYFNPQVRSHYVRWYEQFRMWMRNVPAPQTHLPRTPTTDQATGDVEPATAATPTRLLVVPPGTIERIQLPRYLSERSDSTSPTTNSSVGGPEKSLLNEPLPHPEAAPIEPKAAERRSWELYERAIKSEQREDYTAAVKEYEWIEALRLPEGAGPSDVETRLQRARELRKQRNN